MKRDKWWGMIKLIDMENENSPSLLHVGRTYNTENNSFYKESLNV